ncbi:MAG: PhzF family phenazine biosynthesis protein [Pseudomonadota bacterium]
MGYQYYTVDVFTGQRFGGNQLAVVMDAEGLSTDVMQNVATEFNYSETTFVLPPKSADHTAEVRIFTPERELPFAGHPNVGTAFVLAESGRVPLAQGDTAVVFEEKAGLVPVSIHVDGGRAHSCELKAPGALERLQTFDAEQIAAATGLSVDDIVTSTHQPLMTRLGVEFVIAELRDRSTLGRIVPNQNAVDALPIENFPGMLLYTRDARSDAGSADLRARMFAFLGGLREDPATGSANCALAGLLAELDGSEDGRFDYAIDQGVEMGRPSRLDARIIKRNGKADEIFIGGQCVSVANGQIDVG